MCVETTRGDSQIKSYSLSGLYRQKHRPTQEKMPVFFWGGGDSIGHCETKKSSHENVCNAIKCSRALAATSFVWMARFENRLFTRLQDKPAGRHFMKSVAAKALNCLCLFNTYGRDFVALPNELHLLRRTYHRFIFIAPCVYATYPGPFSGRNQTCQYKRHLKEDATSFIVFSFRRFLYWHVWRWSKKGPEHLTYI